jgi:hypothetical protein
MLRTLLRQFRKPSWYHFTDFPKVMEGTFRGTRNFTKPWKPLFRAAWLLLSSRIGSRSDRSQQKCTKPPREVISEFPATSLALTPKTNLTRLLRTPARLQSSREGILARPTGRQIGDMADGKCGGTSCRSDLDSPKRERESHNHPVRKKSPDLVSCGLLAPIQSASPQVRTCWSEPTLRSSRFPTGFHCIPKLGPRSLPGGT